jgi:hypothetical protein
MGAAELEGGFQEKVMIGSHHGKSKGLLDVLEVVECMGVDIFEKLGSGAWVVELPMDVDRVKSVLLEWDEASGVLPSSVAWLELLVNDLVKVNKVVDSSSPKSSSFP